ncbi:preprotein translocase subunit SecG [Parvularcula lutaonensis]|uniref:Protein-export membrane protein SecG n=1 Tax=Parvularcula lutaonensis TaxID=491923 RepID=A0ABV7MC01_9PROT|nr:preprotein translocase subunit SecG [Parvularcula lutaonensis]GGY49485.1 hypothetical protein GCM10007148_17580 [Parvularcula lutaonensis]
MAAVILTIQVLIVLALIGVVLLQRSDGAGGLGMGGGGGGMMSARGAANALTRATSILAALFFANSLIFSLVFRDDTGEVDFLPEQEQQELRDDDFSDFLSTEEAARTDDAFTLPDDLGVGETAPAEEGPEEAPAPKTDEPQR